MVAIASKGQLDIHIGAQTRTLQFKTVEVATLSKRLGQDPLAFVANSGGTDLFLMEAIFAGLSHDRKAKVSPQRVAAWLDDEENPPSKDGIPISRNDLMTEIFYAIGRGKPESEAKDYIDALDDAFGLKDGKPKPLSKGEKKTASPPVTAKS